MTAHEPGAGEEAVDEAREVDEEIAKVKERLRNEADQHKRASGEKSEGNLPQEVIDELGHLP